MYRYKKTSDEVQLIIWINLSMIVWAPLPSLTFSAVNIMELYNESDVGKV